MHRRGFLGGVGASLFLSGLPHVGFSEELPLGRIVLINLEGGLDGLAAVPPLGDESLQRRRRNIMVEAVPLIDGFFGLHPQLTAFGRLFARGEASVIHATSFPYIKRSHFEGQNVLQSGVTTPYSSPSGWLGRAMDLASIPGRALSLNTPLVLRGSLDTDTYYPSAIPGTMTPNVSVLEAFEQMHSGEVQMAIAKLGERRRAHEYGGSRDPVALASKAAAAMKQEDGPRVAVITVDNFDTHAGQGGEFGELAQQLKITDRVFETFKVSMGPAWKDTIILTATEFGRTVAQNGSAGTDHGYGGVSLLAGGLLAGSRVIANWPGLAKKDLFEGRDLMATLDYRAVCAACIEAAFGLQHDVIADQVFFEPKLPRVFDELFA